MSSSSRGSASSGPLEIVGPWPPPTIFGANVKNSSSTKRSCRRPPNSAGPPSQRSRRGTVVGAQSPHRGRQRQLAGVETDHVDLGSASRDVDFVRRKDDHSRLGLREQRRVQRKIAAAGDNARQRLGREAPLNSALAPLWLADYPAVMLGSDRARAGDHRVGLLAEPVKHRAIAVVAEPSRASANRRATVRAGHEVDKGVGPFVGSGRRQIESR